MKKIPQFRENISVENLGFYELLKVQKCVLSGLPVKNVLASGELPLERVTKQQIIGDFLHTLLASTKPNSTREEIVDFSKKLKDELYLKYAVFFKNFPAEKIEEWSEISNSMKHALNRQIASSSKSNSLVEKLLYSKNKRFKGKPDVFYIEGSRAVVVDYKSSALFSNRVVKPEYVEQLEFYSLLIFDNYDEIQAVDCELSGLRDEKFNFKLERNTSFKFLSQKYNEIFESVLRSLNEKRFTNFSEEACKFCKLKIICPSFFASMNSVPVGRDFFILKGRLVGNELKDNFYKIILENGVLFAPVDSLSIKELKIGEVYLFSDLAKNLSGFTFTRFTEIYEC